MIITGTEGKWDMSCLPNDANVDIHKIDIGQI